jgi:hypothetical protein
VLNNWRHHREDLHVGRAFEAALDPYASGLSFSGWKDRRFRVPDRYVPLPVSPPGTSLLRWQWTRFGRIDPFECPGPGPGPGPGAGSGSALSTLNPQLSTSEPPEA